MSINDSLVSEHIAGEQSPAKGRRERNMADAMERRRQALELRKAGMTYQVIADKLGYRNRNGAWKSIKSALRDIPAEAAHEVKAIELERLDTLLKSIWSGALSGSLGAVDRAIRIMERRARLLGLDATPQVDVHHDWREAARAQGLTDADIEAATEQAATLFEQIATGQAVVVAQAGEAKEGGE